MGETGNCSKHLTMSSSVGPIVAVVLFVVFIVASIINSVKVVAQREVMIIERFGKFSTVLQPGLNFIIPWIDRPKKFMERFVEVDTMGRSKVVETNGMTKVSLKDENKDFPKQQVISRDNAFMTVDALINYKIQNPKEMIYSCVNLPHIMSKLLQAQLRNVAGSLDFDRMVEDPTCLNVLTGLMDSECKRWGVMVSFVRVQKIQLEGRDQSILELVKNAEIQNNQTVIRANTIKQKKVIVAEGQRDSMIKTAEGQAAEQISRAKGMASQITQVATAEARTIKEISSALKRTGDTTSPTKYLLSLKYLEFLKEISGLPNTEVVFIPSQSSFVQTAKDLGVNTIFPAR